VSDPERAKFALSHIGALFKIERSIATAPRKKRERIRDKHSRPVVERFFSWCEAEWPKLLERSTLSERDVETWRSCGLVSPAARAQTRGVYGVQHTVESPLPATEPETTVLSLVMLQELVPQPLELSCLKLQ
jgi:hypothetical protein